MTGTLEEMLAKEFPDKDIRVLSTEPLKIRYREGGCSATMTSHVEATLENAKKLLLECIKLAGSHEE